MIEKGLTREQAAVLDCNGNCVVTARPGSGKTYTIVEKIAAVLPQLSDYQGVIAISFTNKASFELQQRCRARGIDPKQSFWGTIDRFYIGQIIIPFSSHLTGTIPEDFSVSETIEEPGFMLLGKATYPFDKESEGLLLTALKQGIIPLKLTGEIALYLLENVPGVIEYIRARYKYIFIDEYQDCGDIQNKIFTFLVENGIIGIAVGDINQAIYGFTGRYPEFLLSLIKRADFEHFELTKNHRCHESISEYSLGLYGASKIIPDDIRVFAVSVSGNEYSIAKQIDEKIERIKTKYDVNFNNQIGILCRNNTTAKILGEALKTPNKVFAEGILDKESSEWGRLFRELLISYFDRNIFAIDFVEQFFSTEYEPRLYAKALTLCQGIFKSSKSTLKDYQDEMIQLAYLVYPTKKSDIAVKKLHQTLNSDEELNCFAPAELGQVNIMTLHKSKGLEFDVVFHMDAYKYIMPNEYSDDNNQRQDLNLHYVGITRAKKVCYLMLGTKRYRAKREDFIDAIQSPFLLIKGLKERRFDVKWDKVTP